MERGEKKVLPVFVLLAAVTRIQIKYELMKCVFSEITLEGSCVCELVSSRVNESNDIFGTHTNLSFGKERSSKKN
jgi:hypothetical protein